MRCKAVLLAVLCSAAPTSGTAADTDPFEAFLAAKRDLAAQASCPEPPPAPAPAVEAPRSDDVQAAADQGAASEAGQSVSGMLLDAAQAMPEVAPLVDRPAFRVMGVVGARGRLEAVVDPRETGRPRLAAGDLVNGWRVSRVALSEVELVHPERDPVVLPVVAISEGRQ
jgi:hypothetical protein